ncbi:MAG TPA: hypothetical protein VIK86_08300 [Candidatus Paceibacterota bacterium]
MAHAAKHGGSHSSHGASHGSSHGAAHSAPHSGGDHGVSHGAAHGGGHGDSHGAAHGGGGGSHGGDGGGSNIIVYVLVFILFCFLCDATCTRFKKFVNGENTSSPASYTQPDVSTVSTKNIILKKGVAPIRIYIPDGYKCDCSSSGKFYHQDQNGPKEIWGDGTFHQGSEHAAYFDISYYNEEIKFVCEFIKL